ncbi:MULTISPECIES: retropepsin-like aspartic protease [unclassified Caballeronia]|uniref:retropepsin-like aspartic protease n=1 Tax=unclassified Caballeronia TaxID=2646786 RepID=UPI0028625DC2|nr:MULTISPECIES: retropepsin-like aspartic protease [unclassified Caballeronia]MDR5754550.1 retropepsin-like aspartic protease [Caballeronia sp. LZ024]MDR5839521.1 retropepsin-like aspartic protease [Caballeronia sp. LZ031]
MIRKLRRQAIAFCFVALTPWAAAQAQNASPGAGRHLDIEAKLPLTDIGKHYAVPVGFNGETRLFMLDTGSDKTLRSAEAADALQLPRNIAHTEQVNGLGESAEHDYPRIVDSLKLGPVEWTRLVTPTAKMSFTAQDTKASVIGILGNDVLSRFDVELDFPAKTMTLYSARNCRGRFAPWSGDYQA